MNESARNQILSAMRVALADRQSEPNIQVVAATPERSKEQRIELLTQKLEAVRSEVHVVTQSDWSATFLKTVRSKRVKTLLYGDTTEITERILQAWGESGAEDIELVRYGQTIEDFKEKLFELDAAVTTVKGAVAENGALILWPDSNEPRLMSLVPPIHFAVLKASTISNTFAEAIEAGGWVDEIPANVVMVSGPSKTADIELVLAFGVHGPKELVVFILKDC